MIEYNCVRCDKKYTIADHPMAHLSSICKECREIEPETIYDQTIFNNRLWSNK